MGELSASDVFAMTRNDSNNNFLEGNGIIILLLFLLFMGGGFGGFGGGYGNAGLQGSMTRAEMQDGFNNQNTVNSLNNLEIGMNNGFNSVNMGICNGFNGVQSSLSNLGFNMQNCCCEIKTSIHAEGEATRALLVLWLSFCAKVPLLAFALFYLTDFFIHEIHLYKRKDNRQSKLERTI